MLGHWCSTSILLSSLCYLKEYIRHMFSLRVFWLSQMYNMAKFLSNESSDINCVTEVCSSLPHYYKGKCHCAQEILHIQLSKKTERSYFWKVFYAVLDSLLLLIISCSYKSILWLELVSSTDVTLHRAVNYFSLHCVKYTLHQNFFQMGVTYLKPNLYQI